MADVWWALMCDLLHAGDRERHQDEDDRHHDEEFDQGEAGFFFWSSVLRAGKLFMVCSSSGERVRAQGGDRFRV